VTIIGGGAWGTALAAVSHRAGRGLLAAAVVACRDAELGTSIVTALATSSFRLYGSDDTVGVQVSAAVKNVVAIAAGTAWGRGLGKNARAALITQGMAEIVRLGMAKGARLETFLGLAGLGDLTLTCNSSQSRNTSLGIALGEGRALGDVLAERRSVAEGLFTAAAVVALAHRVGVETPICAAIDEILRGGLPADSAVDRLLARPMVSGASRR
jgi:glycerol-3-phosphate dehydrogenase (NAD(P)+)